MHEVLVNRLGGLSLPRKSVVRLTDRPDMTLDVYCGHKTTMQQQQSHVAQSVGHLTRKSGVLGSIPGLATYLRFSFRFFKKGSCQLLAKVCARSTVNHLGGLSLPRKSVVRLTDHPDMTLDVYRGCKTTMQQQQQISILEYPRYLNQPCIILLL